MTVTVRSESTESGEAAVVSLPRHRWTVADYHRMAEAGILTEDDRVELIDGESIEKSPISPARLLAVVALTRYLSGVVGPEVIVGINNPVRLSEHSEPEPNVSLVRWDAPRDILPAPPDVLLVIEVADSPQDYDRGVKLPLYAAAGIPEVWLVDLVAEAIERHTEPHEGRYRQLLTVGRGASLTSAVLPDITIAVDDLLM